MSENETNEKSSRRQAKISLKANHVKRKNSHEGASEASNRMNSRSNVSKGTNEESLYRLKYSSEDALQVIKDEDEPKCGIH